jgi:hypothetical protein
MDSHGFFRKILLWWYRKKLDIGSLWESISRSKASNYKVEDDQDDTNWHYPNELKQDIRCNSYQEIDEKIKEYVEYYAIKRWYGCVEELPSHAKYYSQKQQNLHMKLVRLLSRGYKKPGVSIDEAQKVLIRKHAIQLWNNILALPHVSDYALIEIYKELGTITQEFLDKGQHLGADLTYDDLYKGARTVWFMITFQVIFIIERSFTPSIYGYNMLYPLTDNYIDNPTVTMEEKKFFIDRFRQRLMGDPMEAKNNHEKHVYAMVEEIESQWNRDDYPSVYLGLVSIHDAQTMSMKQLSMKEQELSQNEYQQKMEILQISAMKGAASVIAAGFLIKGILRGYHMAYLAHLGLALQLLDDLQDVEEDLKNNRMSIFAHAIRHGETLDKATARLLNFIHHPILLAKFPDIDDSHVARYVQVATVRFSTLLVLEAASRLYLYYSHTFYRQLERLSPIPMNDLKKIELEQQLFKVVWLQVI